MTEQSKTKEQLLAEIEELRQKVRTLEAAEEEFAKSKAALKATVDYLDIFRRFAEASGEGFGMSDLDGRIAYANPALCRIFGEDKPEDVIGKSVAEYYPPDYLKRRREVFIPALLRDGRWQSEETVLPRSGKPIHAFQSTFLIRDGHGNPVRLAVVVSDITQRKRAEEALRTSEELFRVAFEEAPVGMVMTVDGVITKVNRALSRMSGHACEEYVGRRAIEFTHPEDVAITVPMLKSLHAGEFPSVTVEKRYLKRGGGFYWGRATAASVQDSKGKVAYVLSIVEDITQRKATQEALQQSLEELRTIYDQMAEGIVVIDLETLLPIRANAAICQMLGYSEDEIKSIPASTVHPPQVLPKVHEHMQAVARGQSARFENMPFLRNDGSVLYADVVSNWILYDGRPCQISFLHDVTERKQAQEALAKQHRTLKHLLHSSDHERQLIAYEIHDGLAQQLAGSIMQFQAYQALKETQPKTAIEAFEAGMTMLQQGHKETRHLIAGVRPPILDESGIVEAIDHLVNELRQQDGPLIELVNLVTFDRLVPVLENAIYRICQEALMNACKHSGSEMVRVGLLQQKDSLRMEIRDWGVGFSIKDVPANRFGLEGIRQRTKLLGGKCSIRSRPGKGTRLIVELPVVERDESPD